MRTLVIVTMLCVGLMSCKKTQKPPEEAEPVITTQMSNGLPANPKAINGYFYSSARQSGVGSYYFTYNFYAALCEPTKRLLSGYDHYSDNSTGNFGSTNSFGNIDVGAIVFNNGLTLSKSTLTPNVFYTSSTTGQGSITAVNWTTDGNLSFKPLDISVDRGFPVMAYTATFSPISKGGFSLDITQYASNFDSLIVTFRDNISWQNIIKKNLAAGTSTIEFNGTELSNFNTTANGLINFYAYNYCNKIIDNRIYVFEQSAKSSGSVTINP